MILTGMTVNKQAAKFQLRSNAAYPTTKTYDLYNVYDYNTFWPLLLFALSVWHMTTAVYN